MIAWMVVNPPHGAIEDASSHREPPRALAGGLTIVPGHDLPFIGVCGVGRFWHPIVMEKRRVAIATNDQQPAIVGPEAERIDVETRKIHQVQRVTENQRVAGKPVADSIKQSSPSLATAVGT
jgi:hypothetical protein